MSFIANLTPFSLVDVNCDKQCTTPNFIEATSQGALTTATLSLPFVADVSSHAFIDYKYFHKFDGFGLKL